jgi:hypothetical protein
MTKILIFILLATWNYLVLRLAFEVGGWWKETEDNIRICPAGTRRNKDE